MNLEMLYKKAIERLRSLGNYENIEGMTRFGICTNKTLGVSMPNVRKVAKELGKNHELAIKLWLSEIHEAKILASIVAEKKKVTPKLMDYWIKGFDSWDVCDQACMNLFYDIPCAYEKAKEWTSRKPEFEKRAGFALMACLACKDKKACDQKFEEFFSYIHNNATDERNFVKKAVNWALRQIGKRNIALNKKSIAAAKKIECIDSKSARWIAKDALRELTKDSILKRIKA